LLIRFETISGWLLTTRNMIAGIRMPPNTDSQKAHVFFVFIYYI